ncbi:MAG: ComF family protein [Gammaproteobacteria bacterium]|jgi:ComF family protein
MKAKPLFDLLKSFFKNLIRVNQCMACQIIIRSRGYFCDSCRARIKRQRSPCRLCGLEHQTNEAICAACLYDPPHWDSMAVPLQYDGLVRDLLSRLKYSDDLPIAEWLTEETKANFDVIAIKPDIIIPVPLYKERLIERGYNQAFEIARCLSSQLGIPVDSKSLIRKRHTDSQAGLTAKKREKNLIGAFAFDNRKQYQHVAVVDDIVTTGSTLNEITRVIKRSGVQTVSVWGLARVEKY